MSFETNLIALSMRGGKYTVCAQTVAQVDWPALKKNGLLHNVSDDVGYVDEAVILSKGDFAQYLLPESNPWLGQASDWHAALPREVAFVIVHRAQFDSSGD